MSPHQRDASYATHCVETSLDGIVREACSRELSADELLRLQTMAIRAGRGSEVLLTLLKAGTAASRLNIAGARDLRTIRPKRPAPGVVGLLPGGPGVVVRLPGVRFVLTGHACEQFAARFPSPPGEDERAKLTADAMTAAPIRARTLSGDEQWVSASGARYVLKRDKRDPVCVTVLGPNQGDRAQFRKAPVPA